MADAGVGIETAAGRRTAAGTGTGMKRIAAGTGVETAGDADASGTYLDVLTNLACAGVEASGAGVAVSQLG